MAKHIVKCPGCNQQFDTSPLQKDVDFLQVKNRYWHTSCYKEEQEKKASLGRGDQDVAGDCSFWLRCTTDYLERDLKMSIDWTKFMSQWSNLLKKNKTGKGIYFTLKYIYDVKHCSVDKAAGGIGLVGNLYNEATTYWTTKNAQDATIIQEIERQARKALFEADQAPRVTASIVHRKNAKRESARKRITLEELERVEQELGEE